MISCQDFMKELYEFKMFYYIQENFEKAKKEEISLPGNLEKNLEKNSG